MKQSSSMRPSLEWSVDPSSVSVAFSSDALLSRAHRSVRRFSFSLVLFAAIAAPAAGQVVAPQSTDPGVLLRQEPPRELPQLPAGDLVIQSVKIRDIVDLAPATIAFVSVRNQGSVSIVFPAGSVIARGDATQRGGIAFLALTTPTDFTIAAGESKELTLSVGDVCAAGYPSAVNFRIDPANVVRETNDGNNAMLVQVSSFASGDLIPIGVRMDNQGIKSESIASSLPATETVQYRVEGSGPILHCPGVTLWRETASPVSSKYGLREGKNTSGKAILYNPKKDLSLNTSYFVSQIPGALQPGDLPPGTFTWSIMMNPDGKIRETSSSNNAVTNQITVK